jgi:hypothetical protein
MRVAISVEFADIEDKGRPIERRGEARVRRSKQTGGNSLSPLNPFQLKTAGQTDVFWKMSTSWLASRTGNGRR